MNNILRVLSILILTILLSVTFTACGNGGGGGGGNSNNDGGSGDGDNTPPPDTDLPPDTNESTSLITGYMATKYIQETAAFEDDEKAIDKELAAKGLYNSGHHVERYIDNLNNHVQYFITNSLDYVNQINQTKLIDKASIKVLFNDYKNIHISYLTTYSQNHLGWAGSNVIQYAIDELTSSINNMYSTALYQIDAL